ncbi:hypothetical protein PAHAL_7G208900 [Panicum hallii]|uniref:Uncharacterized protein n=1 Tax=Panicum hallii TaxID=206008 RepID=A0A2T8ICX9_9POAL|nr:hypothetical protein PAHAL_7G208900 [Panicum hallii]
MSSRAVCPYWPSILIPLSPGATPPRASEFPGLAGEGKPSWPGQRCCRFLAVASLRSRLSSARSSRRRARHPQGANPNLKPQLDQLEERPACHATPGAPGLVRDLAHLPAINRHGRYALLLDPPPPDASRLAAKAHPGVRVFLAGHGPGRRGRGQGREGGRERRAGGMDGWRLPVRRGGRARTVTEESEHTAGRDGTDADVPLRPRAHCSFCHPLMPRARARLLLNAGRRRGPLPRPS